MNTAIFLLLGFFVIVAVQAKKYEFSKTAKDCIVEIKTDEDAIRSVVTETNKIPEDNELVQRFFECCYRSFLNDSNELIVNENYIEYVTNAFAIRMHGRRKLAKLVAKDCIEHCKKIKDDSKGLTAVKIMNCLKNRFHEYIDI